MRRILSLIAVALLLPLAIRAETPLERVKSYGDFYRLKDWTKVAGLFDSTALADFREMTEFINELPDENRTQAWGTLFGPEISRDSVGKLSDTAFFAQFLRVMMNTLPQNSGMDYRKFEVIGQVLEGDSVCHVVTRVVIPNHERPLERMEVVSLRKHGETWGLILQWPINYLAVLRLSSLLSPRPSLD